MSIVKNLLDKLSEKQESNEFEPLDFAIEMVEAYDLGTDCLKSTYRNEFSSILENIFETELSKVNESDDSEFANILSSLLFDDMEELDEEKSALVKPYPYHNMFGKPVGREYSPIMKGRLEGGNNDVSVLQLGDKKFMDFGTKDKHWSNLQKQAMTMANPAKAMLSIKRALVNLMVNFKKKRPDIVRRAKAVLGYIYSLAKPNSYFDKMAKINKTKTKK